MRYRHFGLWRELAGPGIHGENQNLVIVLHGNVHVVWHSLTISIMLSLGTDPILRYAASRFNRSLSVRGY